MQKKTHMKNNKQKKTHMKNNKFLIACIVIGVIVVAFAESYLPYYFAEKQCPTHLRFLGQIVWTMDQNMYFSFIRQAFDGEWIFHNRLTYLQNSGAFFNLQFLAIGKLMRLFGLSENAGYQLWRLLGVGFLVCGFMALAWIVLESIRRRIAALCLFIFGGGFGLFFTLANMGRLISKETMDAFTLDLWAGMFPFTQLMANPNFSLPHGIMLLGLALYLIAECKQQSLFYYTLSGVLFLINGLMRPYDLISLYAFIPLFIGIESLKRFNVTESMKRAVPLFIMFPALFYSMWLFKINAIFKYWSMQGHNIGFMPLPHLHLFAYGIILVLAVWRLLQWRSNPISSAERFLLIWFVTVFSLTHIGRVVPALGFSPQIGVPLAAPLVLCGLSLKFSLSKFKKVLFGGTLLFFIVAGNFGIIAHFSHPFLKNLCTTEHYADQNEMNALIWLNKSMAPDDVVLAMVLAANRICKYTSAATVAGHSSVTPSYMENLLMVYSFLNAESISEKELLLLKKLRVKFIYIGPEERRYLNSNLDTANELQLVFQNASVAIYKVML